VELIVTQKVFKKKLIVTHFFQICENLLSHNLQFSEYLHSYSQAHFSYSSSTRPLILQLSYKLVLLVTKHLYI